MERRTLRVDEKVKLRDLIQPENIVDTLNNTAGSATGGPRMVLTATADDASNGLQSAAAVLASPLNGQFYVIGNPSDVLGAAATTTTTVAAPSSSVQTLGGGRTLAPKTSMPSSSSSSDAALTLVEPLQQRDLHPKDQRRRATHNEVERRRRDNINTWIDRLGKLIPDDAPLAPSESTDNPSSSSSSSSSKAKSKGDILARACEYLTQLRTSHDQLKSKEEEIENLNRELEELRRDNTILRQALEERGDMDDDDDDNILLK